MQLTINDEKWQVYGFQGNNPFTDFRGGGVKSLQILTTFCKTNSESVLSMIDPKHEFFLAITSINVSYFFKEFFFLSIQLTL